MSKNLVARRSYKGMKIDSGGYLYCSLVAHYGNPINQCMTKRAGIEDFLRCSCLLANIEDFWGDMFSLFNLNVSIVGVTVDLKKWCVVLDDEVSS